MTKIENNEQYEWAVARVEQLLPLVDETTPRTDSNSIELELLSGLVADYSEELSPSADPIPGNVRRETVQMRRNVIFYTFPTLFKSG